MQSNPYQSPTPGAAATDQQADSFRPAVRMFFRHVLFISMMAAVVVVAATLLERYIATGKIRKLHAPTLLALQIGFWMFRYWYFGLVAVPFYFLFLLGVQSADHRTRGCDTLGRCCFGL